MLPDALAWLDGKVSQRMECGDHWLIYAEVDRGGVLDVEGSTAVHQRRSGANYRAGSLSRQTELPANSYSL